MHTLHQECVRQCCLAQWLSLLQEPCAELWACKCNHYPLAGTADNICLLSATRKKVKLAVEVAQRRCKLYTAPLEKYGMLIGHEQLVHCTVLLEIVDSTR